LSMDPETDAPFEEQVRRNVDLLYRFVLRRAASVEDAADLTQETLLQACRSARSFRGESSFRTWLCGIAQNVCRGHYRRLSRRPPLLAADAGDEERETLAELPDPGPSVEALLEERAELETLRAAVDALPPLQREIILLKDVEGMSYREISEILGVPIGTVRSRIHNATALLVARVRAATDLPPEGD
jgi:RNA polymerase sigma-70 factor, ECF subfamily